MLSKDQASAKSVQQHEPRSAKGTITRAKLVLAAKVVFERDGMLHARIADISKRAKVSYGTFYHYFGSKEALFRELAQAQEDRLMAPPDDNSSGSEHDDFDNRIRDANRRYLKRYQAEAALMEKIEQASRFDSHINSVRMASQRHSAERSERAIKRLQAEGRADARVNPAIAADALGAMVARFAELWLTQGYRQYDFDEVVEQLSLIWANALGVNMVEPLAGPRS